MNWISLSLFFFGFIILLSSFRKKADILSPGRIFTLVWVVALAITELKLSWLQHDWSLEVWIQILIGPISLLLGLSYAYLFYLDKDIKPLNYFRNSPDKYYVDAAKLYKAVVVLFVLFLIGYFSILAKAGTVPLFSSNPGKVRANFTMFGVGLFLHNVVLIVFFTTLYFVIEKKKLAKRRILFLFALLSVLMYVVTLQRFQIMMTVFIMVFLLYYLTNKIKVRTLIITLVVFIAFFYSITLFRVGDLVLSIVYKMSKMKYSQTYAIFTEPYMYLSMNLENYATAIKKTEFFTFGYYTFDFMTALTGIKHWVEEYFQLVDTPFLVSDYNTFPGFFFYYRDFGVLGIFIIPFFGGLGIGSLYYSLKIKPTLLKLGLYGMLLFALIFTFFNSCFGYLWYVYNVIALLVVFKYISRDVRINNV